MDAFISDQKEPSCATNTTCRLIENNENSIQSDVAESSIGVPQGTVLCQIGFSAYDNYLPLTTTVIAILILFSDDNTALIKGKTYQEVNSKAESVNQQVTKFANDNCFRLNAQTTKILQMHTAQTKKIEKPAALFNGN